MTAISEKPGMEFERVGYDIELLYRGEWIQDSWSSTAAGAQEIVAELQRQTPSQACRIVQVSHYVETKVLKEYPAKEGATR